MTGSSTNSIPILDIVLGTSVDGPGLRTSIYSAGCIHHCKGCHNPQSWHPEAGQLYTLDQLMEIIEREEMPVTFSGGDPFYHAAAFAELAHRIHQVSTKPLWCYTGYRFEELLLQPEHRGLLGQIDVLVDGRYEADLRDASLRFRGSSNQRIIDVCASLTQGTIVLWASQ